MPARAAVVIRRALYASVLLRPVVIAQGIARRGIHFPCGISAIFSRRKRVGRLLCRAMQNPGEQQPGGDPDDVDEAQQRLDLLYRDHAPKLRRRLRLRLGTLEEASDVLHDAFARLLGAASRGGLREPEAFLNRIVRNLLIDRSRRLATRTDHMPLDGVAEIGVRAEQSDALEVEQMRDRYRELVALLPDRMRQVFLLHRVDELSYKEIAAQLGISVRTVEWHIAEAIVRISRGLDVR
jgi:RNA polymerase sigma-70 factor (ECF subfamily)